jgi:hypothetical protein
VLKIDSTYHLWYEGDDGATSRIGHATSQDGLIWIKDTANPVLDLGPSGEWDWLHAYGPSVISYNNTFLMWYSGHTLPATWQTGYARSKDGSNWTRQEKLISPGSPGTFDDQAADYSTALVEGNLFKIWYSGSREGGAYAIGHATARACGAVNASISQVYLPLVQKESSSPCPAYYTDDFSDPGSGWPISDNINRKFSYIGGEYQIQVKDPLILWSVTPGAKATDFTASVSARRANSNEGGYGLTFGIDEDKGQRYDSGGLLTMLMLLP